MSVSPDKPVTVPPMPMEWTDKTARDLSSVRLARRIRLELFMFGRDRLPGIGLTTKGSYERFPATPSGWISCWTRIAAETGPDEYAKAVAAWQNRVAWSSTPLRDAAITAELDAQTQLVLPGLAFVGGHGHGVLLSANTLVDLRQSSLAIILTGVRDGATRLTVPASQLIGAEASAPDKAGGPFVATVGHGLLGDLADQQAAQWMNGRFGGAKIRTLVRIQATSCEVFLTCGSKSAEQAQVALSAVRAMAQAGQAAPPAPAGLLAGMTAEPGPVTIASPSADDADLVTKLERLARLREAGALTQFEFQAAKDKLLH